MKIKIRKSNFRFLRPGDFGFRMIDGMVVATRAGFEINPECPKEYKMIIITCINNGWIKPVAVVRDYELTREALCV